MDVRSSPRRLALKPIDPADSVGAEFAAPLPQARDMAVNDGPQTGVYQEKQYYLRKGCVEDNVGIHLSQKNVVEAEHINVQSDEADSDGSSQILPEQTASREVIGDVLVHKERSCEERVKRY